MSVSHATGVVITNPLVKYRALIATKTISPDPAQHRLALHLQDLYERLKDYEPQIEYGRRLDQISRTIARSSSASSTRSWRSMLLPNGSNDSLALTRRMTSLESAMQMQSPQGLMLHGEVGTGKSMLVDLFADCLPTRKKRRWHFNNFMLDTFARLEAMRRSHEMQRMSDIASVDHNDHSMLRLARDMIETSPVLFLDEFQLPDRAASKIMTNLMTCFFHLGGVLIATSNRMPEELAKAAGMEFGPAPQDSQSAKRSAFTRGKASSDKMFSGQNEFASFLEVLKARCNVWEMEGVNDYRRDESGSIAPVKSIDSLDDLSDTRNEEATISSPIAAKADSMASLSPAHFAITPSSSNDDIESLIAASLGISKDNIWTPAVMQVYGRLVPIPRSWQRVCRWTFDELCKSTFGPADYITLASTYDTIILTDVPVLTWLMKNEARRFITLLDALYECRCKLFVTAAAGPDELFFPEKQSELSQHSEDAVYSETFAEAYQDATAPFRPNILTQNPNYAEPDPEPDYTHARLAGLLNADALEDDPPNKPHRSGFARSFGKTDAELERGPVDPDSLRVGRPNFSKTSAFTGEDERFAYKRAQSRLWQMCGTRWWDRHDEDWHRPVPVEVRHWERPAEAFISDVSQSIDHTTGDVLMGGAVSDETRDERSFKRVSSPFRTSSEPPPKFSWTHIWGTVKWGPKAGAWGQGVDGLQGKSKTKE